MNKISQKFLAEWLNKYQQAWENKNVDAAVTLFSLNAEYYETPFSVPAVGIQAIKNYWQVIEYQKDIRFEYEIICVKNMKGYSKWRARYTNTFTHQIVELDGIFEMKFNAEGLCCYFKEWWHREVIPS